jgi:methylmalonyl-CoA/ethylmalonyl-CoA epimerase
MTFTLTGRFHHIGVASKSIHREEEVYGLLGYQREGEMFVDEGQGVRGMFVTGPGPRLELLEPHRGSLTLEPWLQCGARMYHQAYEVDDLTETLDLARRSRRVRVIRAPMSAPAFSGRPVAFLMLRNRAMIELIQSPNGTER